MDDPSEYIDFMAKYKDWISIKRLGIRPETKPEEVVFHMAGIRNTIDLKAFPLLGIKTGALDAAANRLTEGKKKNFADLGQAISGLSGVDAKRAVEEACAERKELSPIARAYLIGKVLNNLEYDAAINQKIMSKIFPDLKIKKPLGRTKKPASD
jgi:hypothetical protein